MIPVVLLVVFIVVVSFRLFKAWTSPPEQRTGNDGEWAEILDAGIEVLKSELNTRDWTEADKLLVAHHMLAEARNALEMPIEPLRDAGNRTLNAPPSTWLTDVENLEEGFVLPEHLDKDVSSGRVEKMSVY